MAGRYYTTIEFTAGTLAGLLHSLSCESEDDRSRFLTSLTKNGGITRYAVIAGRVLLGVFSSEVQGNHREAWWKRVHTTLSPENGYSIFSASIDHVISNAEKEGVAYVMCTLKSRDRDSSLLKQALLERGFITLARKYLWYRHIDTRPLPQDHQDNKEVRIIEHKSVDSNIEELYSNTLEASLDSTSVFEAYHREGLGECATVFVALYKTYAVALCTCEIDLTSGLGWISYIGTLVGYRRLGIASMLLSHAQNDMHASGIRVIRSLVDEQNSPSLRLHRSLMFHKSEEFGDYLYLSLT